MLIRLLFFFLFLMTTTEGDAQELKVAMGSSLPPMHFIDSSGRLAGFEVDLVNLYAREQNVRAVFLDPAQYNTSSLEMVQSGRADMAVNCIAITDDRRQLVDFSNPYFTSGTAFLANQGAVMPFDFYRRTYVVIKNSLYSKQIADRYLPNRKEVRNMDEALALLENEKLSRYLPYTFVFDWTALQEIAGKKSGLKLLDFVIATEEYAAAFKRGGVSSKWNDFITQIRQDGRYQQLISKWFSGKQLPALKTIPQQEYRQGSAEWVRPLLPETAPGQHFAAYLPILNADLSLKRHGYRSSPADKYYDYLVKHYNGTWLPNLEELFFKAFPHNEELFYEFVAEKDIIDMLPAFYRALENAKPYQANKIDRMLAVIAAKHPELRNSIEKTYDQHLEQRTVHISFPPGSLDENNSKINITLLVDNKRAKPVTINISMGHDADIKLLPSKQGTASRLTVNGISGTLKEMTVSGDKGMSIVHIERGIIASYSLPDGCEYGGISNDGKTIYLDFEKFRLFLDVDSHKISRIEIANPLKNNTLIDYGYGKVAGLYYFEAIRSEQDEVYYLEQNKTTVYKRLVSSPDFIQMTTFLGGANSPIILDGKLFSSVVGYDSCAPFNVVDLETGLKLDTGNCGGIVPVGPHEIYYCGGGSWIVNTETLKREKIQNLPCPGKTGSFAPHPLPGYFIYFSWSLC